MESLFYIAIVIAVFLVGREVTLWYFRIPEMIRNQQKTIELLERIASNQEINYNTSQASRYAGNQPNIPPTFDP
jgi:hypothetical protein